MYAVSRHLIAASSRNHNNAIVRLECTVICTVIKRIIAIFRVFYKVNAINVMFAFSFSALSDKAQLFKFSRFLISKFKQLPLGFSCYGELLIWCDRLEVDSFFGVDRNNKFLPRAYFLRQFPECSARACFGNNFNQIRAIIKLDAVN